MKLVDLTGEQFGRWTVLMQAESVKSHGPRVQWLCRCTCGTERPVRACNLRNGVSNSCGCLKRERSRAAHLKHGHCDRRNGKVSRAYVCWQGMRARCNNPRATGYANYGGRGILVCESWDAAFIKFLADRGEPPPGKSIDRITGNYEPDNCRWATRLEQTHNRRPPKRKARHSKLEDIRRYVDFLARAGSAP
jgi:hypothetical protein